ncbi:septum formation inhibitor Maf [Geitlerinema sp. P-1104]|uniref:Maf family protein n=1 Tax=Geitlerinema sp. P-1104 TaxID=2546230 RepID=UPI00147784C6|nr:nucleoside triphosphate pyrophosphatase [Geitlerinema sp. P-1104]NMG57025.1 septum formation inhibitor Maf [Geitlerinema sp. P-1104]
MSSPILILASASPARRQLLRSAGIDPIVCPSDLDESQVQLSNPVALVQTLAQLKGERIAAGIRCQDIAPHSPNPQQPESVLVLACDSVLVLDDKVYGKPANPDEAIARWQLMRGQVGELYTGHAIVDISQNITLVNCEVTKVHFAKVSDSEIKAYVATGEPLNCAGCFAIDGRGSLFVEKIEGCHSNVIGLSLPLFRRMLLELGYNLENLW